MALLVTKADGTVEAFDESKLLSSLQSAGANASVAATISAEMQKSLYSGIATSEIYRHAFARLREMRHGAAARYSLKRAVMEFGPSGFPFEAYLAELFRAEGGEAITDQMIPGACVEHEVDVVVRQGNVTTYVEAKFHNALGLKTDLKTSLYVKARMDDIRAFSKTATLDTVRGLLVTNTKFTDKAIQYGVCEGLGLLSWDYPQRANLHTRVDAANLYPITALTTLSHYEKTALLQEKMVLCTALPHKAELLGKVGIKGKRADAVLEEVGALCVPGKDIL